MEYDFSKRGWDESKGEVGGALRLHAEKLDNHDVVLFGKDGSNGLVGTFNAGATSCAPVITTGVTAPHGFVCEAHDWTTPADTLSQASTTTTTATFGTATVVSGDTIGFSCKAF